MSFPMKYLIPILLSAVLSDSCGNSQQKQQQTNVQSKEFQDKLIEANKMYVKKESDEIDMYARNKGWQMTTSGTGLRYMIDRKGAGETARPEQLVTVSYRISLLDGTLCYSSEEEGPKEFKVAHDNVETGLHEAIQYMRKGDEAVLILPSHLAHGLMGDSGKIPPKASVVYEIKLLSIR
jgi:gliding motility-associated peptidyl-prolyl isomerase